MWWLISDQCGQIIIGWPEIMLVTGAICSALLTALAVVYAENRSLRGRLEDLAIARNQELEKYNASMLALTKEHNAKLVSVHERQATGLALRIELLESIKECVVQLRDDGRQSRSRKQTTDPES